MEIIREEQIIDAFKGYDISCTGNNVLKISESLSNLLNDQYRARLTKEFNFASQQVTSLFSARYENGYTSQMTVQNFSDIDSWDEIKAARAQLEAVGKKPKELHKQPGQQ